MQSESSISRESRHLCVPTFTPLPTASYPDSDTLLSSPSSLYHFDHSLSLKEPCPPTPSDTLEQTLSDYLNASMDFGDLSMQEIPQDMSFSQIPPLFSSTPQKDKKDTEISTEPRIFEQDSIEHSSSDLALYPHEHQDLNSHFKQEENSITDLSETLDHESTDILDASLLCPHFPIGHRLNPYFSEVYELEDELGAGGYGFVMTAVHREDGYEVAVKFIIKSKVPEHAWVDDERMGRLPLEVMLLSFVDHRNIVKGLDLFEDSIYYYLVQELHGSPWHKRKRQNRRCISSESLHPATPYLSPSISTTSLSSSRADSSPEMPSTPLTTPEILPEMDKQQPSEKPIVRPFEYHRRPSHDLFECIEQSEEKRLSERQAKYVFAQVVDAVYYLDKHGISHRDIKDENLVIDKDLRVKLIDFGSASCVDPKEPRPYYTLFYGTTAYASPEILLKKEYQAAPAEIWTLGVLLSYLLTGNSPFPTVKDAIQGRMVIGDLPTLRLSRSSMSLMRRCLDPDPKTRATLAEVRAHRWFR